MHILRAFKKEDFTPIPHRADSPGISQLERTEAGKVLVVKGQVWDSSDTAPKHNTTVGGTSATSAFVGQWQDTVGSRAEDEGDVFPPHHLQG